jgi:hypothetical protein
MIHPLNRILSCIMIGISFLMLASPVMSQTFIGGDAPRVVAWSPQGDRVAMLITMDILKLLSCQLGTFVH